MPAIWNVPLMVNSIRSGAPFVPWHHLALDDLDGALEIARGFEVADEVRQRRQRRCSGPRS